MSGLNQEGLTEGVVVTAGDNRTALKACVVVGWEGEWRGLGREKMTGWIVRRRKVDTGRKDG